MKGTKRMNLSLCKPCAGFFLQGATWAIAIADMILVLFFMMFNIFGTMSAYEEFSGDPSKLNYLWSLTTLAYAVYISYIPNAVVLMKASRQRKQKLCLVHLIISIVLIISGVALYGVNQYYVGLHVYISILFLGFTIYKCYCVWIIISFILEIKRMGDYNHVLRDLNDAEVQQFVDGDPSFVSNSELLSEEACAALPFDPSYTIPLENLEINSDIILGSGAYGLVLKGIFKETRAENGVMNERVVAVKTTKPNAEISYFKALLLELKVMAFLGPHENIVNLLGAVTNEIRSRRVWIVVELCEEGSVQSFLRRNKHSYVDCVVDDKVLIPEDREDATQKARKKSIAVADNYTNLKTFSTEDLLAWGYQVCKGMEFLSSKRVVHGDLAARNVLLTADLTAKITDFGLSRKMYSYKPYFTQNSMPLPWRHLPVESLAELKFSTMTDVWAFGILLWEMFSLGQVPYPGMSWTNDFCEMLKQGLRPNKPETCPSEMYEIMKNCWRLDPDFRPSFQTIKSWLLNMLAEVNPREYDCSDTTYSYYGW